MLNIDILDRRLGTAVQFLSLSLSLPHLEVVSG
jgi:hypothetical protein